MRRITRREMMGTAGALLAASSDAGRAQPRSDALALWFRQPAKIWTEALPVGDGRIGAMVFGGAATERLQLNEHTLWSGHPVADDDPQVKERIAAMRRLLLDGKYAEANALGRAWHPAEPGGPRASYQELGNLWLDFGPDAPEEYRRELDLDTGIAGTQYRAAGGRHTREVFVSEPDAAMLARIADERPGGVSFTVRLDRSSARGAAAPVRGEAVADNRMRMRGQAANGGVIFEALVEIRTEGGSVRQTAEGLRVEGARAATLFLTAGTNYRLHYPDFRGDDPAAGCAKRMAAVAAKPYAAVRAAHVAEHRRLFRRVALDLGGPDRSHIPTDERLAAVQKGAEDRQLTAVYFQFGRYLLMSSSRPGTLPANLQGIWADGLAPPWQADYHVNINIQMNYWPAEVCNLSECHQPLFDFIDMLRQPGARTARVEYGCRGWVAHYTTDAWGHTAIELLARYAMWQGGSGWLAQHLWEHYWFTGDREFLRQRAWPVLKSAAEFYLDYVTEDPRTGKLVAGPAQSPENQYFAPDGSRCEIDIAPTMAQELVHDVLTNAMAASEALAVEPEFRARCAAARERLLPLEIGKHGQIQEWSQDFDEPEPGHRHMSQLFALHPGRQITPRGTPELAAAAQKTLERRLANGGGHTGWSRAWIILFWARLEKPELAHENVMALLAKSTLSNLFDTHPPFQIDGNFGGVSAIAEMLLQSHAGEISLLPALPRAWPDGSFRGLRARGGLELDVTWRGGEPAAARLHSEIGGTYRIRTRAGVRSVTLRPRESRRIRFA